MMTSRIPGFHRLSREARLERLAETVGLDDAERQLLRHGEALDLATADCMIENAIGVFGLPLRNPQPVRRFEDGLQSLPARCIALHFEAQRRIHGIAARLTPSSHVLGGRRPG